jgi:hypothetical protein
MELPTNEELERALLEMAADGALPLANCVDRNELLDKMVTEFVRGLTASSPGAARDYIKAAMTTGLNVGIRIGENRHTGDNFDYAM